MKKYCIACGQKIPKKILEKRKKMRSESIRKALSILKKSGIKLGRPRKEKYGTIYNLRDKGKSIQWISDYLQISRGSVQHALSLRK